MKNVKVVNEVISGIENKNWNAVNQCLTDDFTFSGATPQPIDKKQWVDVHRAISAGLPDLSMNLHDVKTDGEKVRAKVRLSGTHTATLPPVLPNSPSYPATGEKIELPEEEVEITFKGDKISNFLVKSVPNGGVQGLINQVEEAVHEKAM